MEKKEKIPYPTQCGSSISEYIKMIKLHAIGIGKDLDDIDIKVKFICGLSPDNEKRVREFGVKKPLIKIFKYLDKVTTQPLIQGGGPAKNLLS